MDLPFSIHLDENHPDAGPLIKTEKLGKYIHNQIKKLSRKAKLSASHIELNSSALYQYKSISTLIATSICPSLIHRMHLFYPIMFNI